VDNKKDELLFHIQEYKICTSLPLKLMLMECVLPQPAAEWQQYVQTFLSEMHHPLVQTLSCKIVQMLEQALIQS
jgi:hypothetical protein